jgi:MFS family permease
MAVFLAMAPWFAAAAAASWLADQGGLDGVGQGWLTGAVQLGFVLGTLLAAFLNVADVIPARILFGVSALLAAGVNLLTLGAGDVGVILMSRGLTGFFLAGVYPPAMKMAATWFDRSRGMAIGVVVGALTLGKALPFLFLDGLVWEDGMALGGGQAIRWTSLAGLVGGLLILGFWRVGPHPFPHRPFALGRVWEVLRHRPTRLAIGGYVGHMWELYTMWALIALFFQFYLGEMRPGDASVQGFAPLLTFAVIGVGGLGAVFAGIWADRIGRIRIAVGSMAISGLCALGVGWIVSAPVWLMVAVTLVWGVAIVADSAQFSALVTEVAPPHAVGTALTLQTAIGFLVTVVSIFVGTTVADRWGWGPAFSLLAVGPALGIVAMWRLHRSDHVAPGRRA